MTAKEKAKDLLSKMDVIHYMPLISKKTKLPINMHASQVKECALIAIDEILESNPTLITCNTSELNYAYWIEVKNQINQL
jgi:hypothetical protein